jgi:hypothetical protein
MIHRLAISIGTIAAAAVLALGFAASGFGPAAAPANAGQPTVVQQPAVTEQQSAATQDTEPAAKPITKVKTETIYVKPAPKPKVIHVTKRQPAATAKRPKAKVTRENRERPAKHQDREDREDHEDEDEHEDEDREGRDNEDKHEDEDD